MPLLYNFDIESPEELLAILARNMQKRRLEKLYLRLNFLTTDSHQ